MIVAIIIYLWAGVGFTWALDGNGIQRAVMVLFWLPLVTYGMVYDLVVWWKDRAYIYDNDTDDGRDPG